MIYCDIIPEKYVKRKFPPQEESLSKLRRSILMEIHPDKWQGHPQQLLDNTEATQVIFKLYKNSFGKLDVPSSLKLWLRSSSGLAKLHTFDLSNIVSSDYFERKAMIERLFGEIEEVRKAMALLERPAEDAEVAGVDQAAEDFISEFLSSESLLLDLQIALHYGIKDEAQRIISFLANIIFEMPGILKEIKDGEKKAEFQALWNDMALDEKIEEAKKKVEKLRL